MNLHDLQDRADDLDRRFWAWRAVQAPRSRDDLPRVGPARGLVPGLERRRRRRLPRPRGCLRRRARRLCSDAAGRSAPSQAHAELRRSEVDVRLIGSAIARARFELDVLRSWQRDPWFYLDQTIGTIFDLLLPPPPVDDGRCARAPRAAPVVRATLEAGRRNCAGELASELGAMAHEVAPTAGADLVRAAWPRSPRSSAPQWPARIEQAGRAAAASLDGYARWLASALPGAQPLRGAGELAFARYIYEVALLPFTPAELLAAGRQEWDRAVAFELFEQHRVPDAPWPPLSVQRRRPGRSSGSTGG